MFEEQIAKGVEYLDQDLGPSWVERIRVERLNLNDCFRCVIGQVYGNFYKKFDGPGADDDQSAELGFSLATPTSLNAEAHVDRGNKYYQLTQEWKKKIAQLRAERTN